MRTMFKKLMIIGLVMCMLLIGAKMYPFPVTFTKMMVLGTEVILLGDRHTMNDEAAVAFKKQIDESNDVLREWVESLSHSNEETLFLLEENGIDLPPSRDAVFRERADTLCFLKNLAKRESSVSSVKFKYADRRTEHLKTFDLLFDAMVLKIIRDVPKDLESTFLNETDLILSTMSFEDLETELRAPGRREIFFSETFPRIMEILSSFSTGSEGRSSYSAEEFLNDLTRVVPELEESRRGYAPGTYQYNMLGNFLERINDARVGLEAFFDIYQHDRTQPFGTAVFNSVEKTHSFQPYIDLNRFDINVRFKTIIRSTIADAGFYMDVTNAVRSGAKRVVLYAGNNHVRALIRHLITTYGESIVIETVGPIGYGSGFDSIDHLLSPVDLRRILGVPGMDMGVEPAATNKL